MTACIPARGAAAIPGRGAVRASLPRSCSAAAPARGIQSMPFLLGGGPSRGRLRSCSASGGARLAPWPPHLPCPAAPPRGGARRGPGGVASRAGGGGAEEAAASSPDVDPILPEGGGSSSSRWAAAGWLILGLAWAAWGNNIGAAGLVDDTEPLFAEAARQMVETGDWLTPQFNAQPRFDKPALIYWIVATSLRVFGTHVWAARLPSALAAAAFALALFATVRRFGLVPDPERAGAGGAGRWSQAAQAAAVWCMSPLVFIWGSTALSDMLLCTTMGGTLLAWFHAYAGAKEAPPRGRWGYPAAAVLCGLAVLTKGPVGLALPGAAVVLFLAYTGELWRVVTREIPFLSAGATFLATSAPWYVAMAAVHGKMYLATFFGYHNWERYTKGVNHHGNRPRWYPLAMIMGGYFPWSLCLPAALAGAVGGAPGAWGRRRAAWAALPRGRRLTLLAASYMASTVAVFSMSSSQLPSYYLPVAPAVALLAAGVLATGPAAGGAAGRGASAAAVVGGMAALGGAMAWLPGHLAGDPDPNTAAIGAALAAGGIAWRGAAAWGCAVAATLVAAARRGRGARGGSDTGAGGEWGLAAWWGSGWAARVGAIAAAGMASFLLLAFTPAFRIVDRTRQLPLRRLAVAAARAQRPGEPIMMAGARMPSVVWYAQRPVAFFDTAEEAARVARTRAAPGVPSALLLSEAPLLRGGAGAGADVVDAAGGYELVRLPLGRGGAGGGKKGRR